MPSDQLCRQRLPHVLEREMPGLGRHLRIKQHLQQQIAKLIAQLRPGPPLDRVENLIRLFQRVPLNGVKGLLPVPRAATGPAKPGHDGCSLCHRLSGLLRSFLIQRCFIRHGPML